MKTIDLLYQIGIPLKYKNIFSRYYSLLNNRSIDPYLFVWGTDQRFNHDFGVKLQHCCHFSAKRKLKI